mmetsp:Transcript_61118/g.108801  ORF Transcript_61118/g.108801 Transcript_61118/m.108801 type:complete len:320 (-) Transcript_61118:79-1038(-)
MAAASAPTEQADVLGKKRVSKGVKRKAKRQLQEEIPESVESTPASASVATPEAAAESAEGEKTAVKAKASKGPAKTAKKTKANRLEEMQAAAERELAVPRGVIYVGHVPDGFYEPQMKKFFQQFGRVTRLRLSRSKKNARSKGYAFVEFEDEGVAEIVAQTMHKYLLFGKQLVCHIVPKEKQHPALFKGCRKKMVNFSHVRRKKFRETYNDRPTVEVDGEDLPRLTVRQADRQKKQAKKLKGVLANFGIEYDVDEVLGTTAEGRGSSSKASATDLPDKPAEAAAPEPPAAVAAPAATPAAAAPAKKKRKKMASAATSST